MKVNPNQGSVPGNDEEPNHKDGGGENIFGFADVLRKLVLSKPMLLPLLRYYGFRNKRPFFRRHAHIFNKQGKEIGVQEFSLGSKSIFVYIIFFIEFAIRLILVGFYLIAITAILLVILRGLELPEYVRSQFFQQQAPPINVKIVNQP